MPGAKPQISPPTAAAARVPTSRRRSSTYQATAVPARQQTTATQNATCEPKSRVTGVERDTQAEHRGVRHQVDPVGRVQRRCCRAGSPPSTTRVRRVGQHPLEEDLVTRLVEQPPRATPLPAGHQHGEAQIAGHHQRVPQPGRTGRCRPSPATRCSGTSSRRSSDRTVGERPDVPDPDVQLPAARADQLLDGTPQRLGVLLRTGSTRIAARQCRSSSSAAPTLPVVELGRTAGGRHLLQHLTRPRWADRRTGPGRRCCRCAGRGSNRRGS